MNCGLEMFSILYFCLSFFFLDETSGVFVISYSL